MQELLDLSVNFSGLVVGLSTFLIIGMFHPIVIKAEYYCGVKVWWVFLLGGIAALMGSLFMRNFVGSTILGVVAFSCFWSILELFQQRERVRRGWFPRNPKREARAREKKKRMRGETDENENA